jgi:mannose-1-phosphate guanylyltransferase
VPIDATGCVSSFIEKPPAGSAPTNLINAGTYVLELSVLEDIPQGRAVSIERETFPSLIGRRGLYAMATADYWLDAGTPEKYVQGQLDILRGLRTPGSRPDAAEVAPGSFVADGGIVQGRLSGVGFVGPGAVVAAGAVVMDSVVGAGARVLAGARVTRSTLLPGAVVGEGCDVSDSIVGPGAVLGTGARLERMTVVRGGVEVPAGAVLSAERYPL